MGITTPTGITLAYASRPTRLLGQCVDGFVASAPFLIAKFLGLGFILAIPAGIWAAFYLIHGDGLHAG
jgi:hypothetical protein